MNLEQVRKFIEPLKRKVQMIVGRAVIAAIKDDGPLQTLQLTLNRDEVRDDVQRVQEYGFTSFPKVGAEAFVAFLGGNRDHGVVIAVDDRRYRFKPLSEGEVAIYTDEGDKIHFKRGKKIDIETNELTINSAQKVTVNTAEAIVNASTKASITAPTAEITAPTGVTVTTPLMAVSGLISCAGLGAGGTPVAGQVFDGNGSMEDMRSVYNSHTHRENNGSPTANTDQPNQPMS